MFICFDSDTMADTSVIEDNFANVVCEGPLESELKDEALETPAESPQGDSPIYESYDPPIECLMKLIQVKSPEIVMENLPSIVRSMESDLDISMNRKNVDRTQVLLQFPKIAEEARESFYKYPEISGLVVEHLLRLNLAYIDTPRSQQMREVAQSVLFQFVAQGFVTAEHLENRIWPIVLSMILDVRLIMELHADGIMLMCKLGQFLGVETTERLLLPHFLDLCNHEQFYIRQICLPYFGEFFSIVSREVFENILFPKYLELCEDKNWGVRKKCAKVVMSVSCACSAEVRRTKLAPVFIKLLQDKNRWVRMAAYQLLGPFISTFAEPTITRLSYNSTEDLVIIDPNGNEFSLTSPSTVLNPFDLNIYQYHGRINPFFDDDGVSAGYFITGDLPDENDDDDDDDEDPDDDEKTEENGVRSPGYYLSTGDSMLSRYYAQQARHHEEDAAAQMNAQSGAFNLYMKGNICDNVSDRLRELVGGLENSTCSSMDGGQNGSVLSICENSCDKENGRTSDRPSDENLEQFNSYNYWKVCPDLPLDPEIVGEDASFRTEENPLKSAERTLSNHLDALLSKINFDDTIVDVPNETNDRLNGNNEMDSKPMQLPIDYCDQVPYPLVQHFVSMTDKNVARMTDNDMAYHCAYSLPAVALTLGNRNWHLIEHVLDKLASDFQYKVRRTLAYSLHVLASILGPEIASQDLTPIFYGFIKDLDEVRIGVLKNLAHFLKLINAVQRSACLPKLIDFLRTDNERNWRFRHELASQLVLAVTLFTPADIAKHLSNISQALLCDKVAAVKQNAILLMVEILKHISSKKQLTQRLLVKLAERFAHSKKWQLRQTYASLCAKVLSSQAIPQEQFASEAMPHLLDLSWDPVANVRLVVAKTISQNILTNEYFCDSNNQHYYNLKAVLRRLQADKDTDVRCYALRM